MAVAAREGFVDDQRKTLRVATKFPRIAKFHYAKTSRAIDIIELNGSIELAPILDMSDVIVDIVETGITLRENRLRVIQEIFPISARLIVNKAAFQFKTDAIRTMTRAMEEAIAAKEKEK